MSEPMKESDHSPRKRDLSEALRRVRLVKTEQSDGLADLRDAEIARLELLADSLSDQMAELPDEHDFFAFALSNGETPRLWIDMTCHVALGRDKRTYRLLKDTRLGRTVLFESADRDEMTTRVTDYVAERILDRQRIIEGDWIELRARTSQQPVVEPAKAPVEPAGLVQPKPGDAANEDVPTVKRRMLKRPPEKAADADAVTASAKWISFAFGVLVGAGALAFWMIASGRL